MTGIRLHRIQVVLLLDKLASPLVDERVIAAAGCIPEGPPTREVPGSDLRLHAAGNRLAFDHQFETPFNTDKSPELAVVELASSFVRALPLVAYQGAGLNPEVHLPIDTSVGDMIGRAELNLCVHPEARLDSFGLSSASSKWAVRVDSAFEYGSQAGPDVPHAIRFRGNVHVDTSMLSGTEASQRILSFLESWQDALDHFGSIVQYAADRFATPAGIK